MSRTSSSRSSTRSRASRARRWWSAATAATSTARSSRSSSRWPPPTASAGAGRPGRHPVDARRLARHPQPQGLRRHHPLGQPQSRRPDGDFGIKYNIGNGGPAPEKITEAIFARTKTIDSLPHRRFAADRRRPRRRGAHLGQCHVEVIDPVADYAELMERLFDFEAIRALFRSGFRCASTPCTRSPAPTPTRSSRARSARPRAR